MRALHATLLALVVVACGADGGAVLGDAAGDGGPPVAADPSADAGPTPPATPDASDDSDVKKPLLAGAARVDATPVVGLPLGGYGDRRRDTPQADPSGLAKLFKPSTGVKDPLYCRALVLSDGETKASFVSIDAVAVIGHFIDEVIARAKAKGATATAADTIVFASHSHSGPGAMTDLKFFEYTAMDMYVKSAEDAYAESCANALATAEANLAPAHFGAGSTMVEGVTENRRAGTSPYVTSDTVDPGMWVYRIDRPDGTPVAVLWNYAIHGTALGPDNLEFSADIMGVANTAVEAALPGIVSLFANGAEGDTAPDGDMSESGGKLADGILEARTGATTRDTVAITMSSHEVTLGTATFVVPPEAIGDLSLGPIGGIFDSGVAINLGPAWVDHDVRFQAVRLDDHVLATVPGEAILEIGQQVRAKGAGLGFSHVSVIGLASGYVGYITSPREFDAGGYEATMSLFGREIGNTVVAESMKAMFAVK